MMIEVKNILDIEKYIHDMEAVIFDLDDTLYSEKGYVKSGYQKIAEYFGKPELYDQLWNAFENGRPAIDEALEANGLLSYKDKALHIYRFQLPDIQLYPGVAQMLARIRLTKKVGIITDGRPEGQLAKIQALGIQVDEIIITDELGGIEFRKPNEKSFRLMRARLGTDYKQMVYVGDNIKKDFIAPEKLGMKTIWFRNQDGLYVM